MFDDGSHLNTSFDDETVNPFTDLMPALLATLLLMLVVSKLFFVEVMGGNVDLRRVCEAKQRIVVALAKSMSSSTDLSNDRPCNDVELTIVGLGKTIRITNEPTSQRFSFEGDTIFEQNRADLLPGGQEVLRNFGSSIAPIQNSFEEIQILGHTDNVGSEKFNLQLGAQRAMTVFDYMVGPVGINPLSTLVSVSSFGFYSPVARMRDATFSSNDLYVANSDDLKRRNNRRIEILIKYKFGRAEH
ncbi:OmpA family protein [Rhizobium sp. Leaf371]|uniref:OmpA family protein n=1 Tax=Rhizobium sp. Leaf371 TaxID=1736355 RepID=UPI000B22EA2D|nr:OmpA family protein [Rhizobium sp. Leaf371]